MTTEFNVSWRRYLLPPLDREGPKFVAVFAVAALLLFWLWEPLGWVGIVLTVWCFYFFRDPDRYTPMRKGLVITPASGVVSLIKKVAPPKQLDMGDDERWRVSVFMSVFDCHVNRMPVGGTIRKVVYIAGKFVNASLDKASEDNERNMVHVTTEDGKDLAFVQIAGLVARRIRCDIKEGQVTRTGERMGMIRFGQPARHLLAAGSGAPCCPCQTCVSGETVIADMMANEQKRDAEAR